MKKYTKKLLEKIDGKTTISDKFHDLTNNRILNKNNLKDFPKSWIKIYFKTYPRLDRFFLKFKFANNKFKLGEFIKERRSIRNFSGKAVTLNELSYILFSSCGLISNDTMDNSRRPYPSAGARYPLEVYPIILRCEPLEKGLYHYNVKKNSLELLLKEDLTTWLTKACADELWLKNAAVVFIITGVLDRTRIKYGDRGYRYVLIEVGALSQNISIISHELGLGSCLIGGYIDSEINKILDINLQKEYSLCLIAVGKYGK